MSRCVSQRQAARSGTLLETFVATITEKSHEVEQLLEAVNGDEIVSQGFRTGFSQRVVAFYEMELLEYLRLYGRLEHDWVEFCITHGICRERFEALMDPVLDIWTGAFFKDVVTGHITPIITFRDVAEDSGYINLIDLIGPAERDGETQRTYIALKIWLAIAHYLALHPSVPTPPWMEP